jgi:Type II secretion system (T2SS), protein E, N-terminal domain
MSPIAPIGTSALRPKSVVTTHDGANSEKGSWMSANPPADGMFFVDQPQPAEPVVAPAPAPAPVPEPVPSAMQQPAEAGKPAGMLDVPLGTLIFRAGLLAEEQVEDALQEGMRTGKRLGEVLLERGWLHERDLGRLLAGQKGLPFIELGAVSPDPAAVQLLPEEKARFQTALPIGFEDGVPVIAVADPSNSLVIENLRRALNTEPRLVVAAYSELVRKIDHAYAALAAPAPQPAPEPQVVAQPPLETPAPAPLVSPAPVVEPVTEQPAPSAVTPMPAVLPPAEPLVPDSVEHVAPLVTEQPAAAVPEPAPSLVQPLAEQPVFEQPPVVEQPVVEPAPAEQFFAPQPEAAQPQVAAPVADALSVPAEAEAAPAPVVEPLSVAAEAEVAPPPVVEPLSVPAEPEVAAPPAVEPLSVPVEPEPASAPVVVPAAEEAPTHVPEFSQVPVPVEEPVLQEPVAQEPVPHEPVLPEAPVEEPSAEPSTDGVQAESAAHFVVLRLSDGEHLEVGTFGSPDEAQRFAQEVVRQIAATEGESAWPFFAGRFLRPETIVSVDVIAESQERWMGSQIRSRWAAQ